MSLTPSLSHHLCQHPVLVIDDSALQREMLCGLLQSLGFTHISQARDGQEALALLRQAQVEPLIVVDLEMPRMDGIELLQYLAEEKILAPVIIASGREAGLIHTVENMLQANGLPFLGSLHKPVCGNQLHHLLSVYDTRPPTRQVTFKHRWQPCADDLAKAMQAEQIVPFYQPKVALSSGRLIGYEVLARWQMQSGVYISPAEFIPLALQENRLLELTDSLLNQALAAQNLLRDGNKAPCMSINIDMSLLAERRFADLLIARVKAANSRADEWILEITESSLMRDPAATLASVGRLRLAGFGLSIDDYGTGFSTLKQLTELPFTELKIDRSFVAQAHRNQRAHGILQSAINMGRTLNLPCVAEGIEQVEDVELLLKLGCYAGQGYLFAKPMALQTLTHWHFKHSHYDNLALWL